MKTTDCVSVYRDSWLNSDCTGGGVTSRHHKIRLFWECTREEAVDYCKEHGIDVDACLWLQPRELWGEDHSYARPLVHQPDKVGPMFGGNFIYTSDANFPKLYGLRTGSPIPVHDRYETQEEYDALSV